MNKKKNIITKYNDAKVVKVNKKGKKVRNGKVIALKTGVDTVSAVAIAPAINAGLGIWGPLAGLLLIGLGHIVGDKSGLLRVTGAAAIGYGLAKAVSNRNAPQMTLMDGVKSRFTDLKDDWLYMTHLDKVINKESDDINKIPISGVGAIDLSALDMFDDLNQQSAMEFESRQSVANEMADFEDDLAGIDYAIIEDEIDYSTL